MITYSVVEGKLAERTDKKALAWFGLVERMRVGWWITEVLANC